MLQALPKSRLSFSDELLESLSSYPGIIGAMLMSLNTPISGVAFFFWLPGNIATFVLMGRDNRRKMQFLFVVHTLCSLNGIYQWFIR